MRDFISNQQNNPLKIKDLSFEEKGRLVGVFAWLVQEDKKQNPALYQNKIKGND